MEVCRRRNIVQTFSAAARESRTPRARKVLYIVVLWKADPEAGYVNEGLIDSGKIRLI
jgi:hypothetical protein